MFQIRNHNLEDANKKRFRYMAITIDVSKARTREFDSKGEVCIFIYHGLPVRVSFHCFRNLTLNTKERFWRERDI